MNRRDYSCRYPDNLLYSTFRLHESMISDRFVVPEIEIANPPDAIGRARARASSSVHNWADFLGKTNDDDDDDDDEP